jgi:hypothetical protein
MTRWGWWRVVAALVMAAAGVLVGGAAAGAGDVFTVYLSPTGSDGADGLSPGTAVLSLGRAQDVLRAAATATDVEVRIAGGTYHQPPVTWSFYVPGHTISFLPIGYDYGDPAGLVRPVFKDTQNSDGTYSRGYWMHPELPSDKADPMYGGGTSGLRFYYLQVQNYSAGGLSLDGDTGRDTTDGNYSPPLTRPGSAGLNGNTLVGMEFTHLGNKWSGGHYGWGAVVLTNSSNNTFSDNIYNSVENTSQYAGYIHGLYITHFSSHNTVTGDKFRYVSGDAVKVRDRSNYNSVQDSQFYRSGSNSYYRDEFCDKQCAIDNSMARQCASYHNRFFNNDLQSGYSGATSLSTWSLSPDGLTYAGVAPCSIPSGDQRLRTGGNT